MGNETFRKFQVTNKGIFVGTDRKTDEQNGWTGVWPHGRCQNHTLLVSSGDFGCNIPNDTYTLT